MISHRWSAALAVWRVGGGKWAERGAERWCGGARCGQFVWRCGVAPPVERCGRRWVLWGLCGWVWLVWGLWAGMVGGAVCFRRGAWEHGSMGEAVDCVWRACW